MDQTNVFIISAPSGSGKSTLVELLLSRVPGLVFSVSYTTRLPRGHEQNGKQYYFVGRDEFEAMIERDALLEWAVVFETDYYGTARRFLDEAREKGYDLVLDIDVQGAQKVKTRLADAHSIFILPPSPEEMEARLRRRGEDAEAVIERRLRSAWGEIREYPKYDYVIVNDDLDKAFERLYAVVQAARWRKRHPGGIPDAESARWIGLSEKCRTQNAGPEAEEVLKRFSEERVRGSH
jgi:guanylate kinase